MLIGFFLLLVDFKGYKWLLHLLYLLVITLKAFKLLYEANYLLFLNALLKYTTVCNISKWTVRLYKK